MEIPEKVAIFGLGKTGLSLVRFLKKMERKIIVFDEKKEEDLKEALAELEEYEFERRFGEEALREPFDAPLVLFSPGVQKEHPFLKKAEEEGKIVMGELEFSSRFIKEPIIAVTGTNGKTTTTTLLGEILRKAFGEIFVGGNIGRPLIDYVYEGKKAKFLVLEVSSFQLDSAETFRPSIAILLNITEDHLERYRNFEAYRNSKFKIFKNQKPSDFAILKKGLLKSERIRSKIYYFSAEETLEEGAFLKDRLMVVRVKGREFLYRRDNSPLFGLHNTENLLSILLASHLLDIDKELIEETIGNFKGLPHRLEFVGEKDGVFFYNDSKATNVDATKRAIESLDGRIILIAGGRDKGGSYKVLLPYMNKIKALILFGEAKEKIGKELGEYTQTFFEKDLFYAVHRAKRIAEEGDKILFSPMCSSFDMFRNYEERGENFKKIIEGL